MAEKLTTRAAIFVIIKNEAGQVLLQQRANTGYLDGYYDLACSGHIDDGESIHEAAVRELEEELGISANVDDLQLVHINHNYADTPYINFIFELHRWRGTPRITEPHKCSDLRYFDIDSLPEKCTLSVRLCEHGGFSQHLTYSKVTSRDFAQIVT